MARKILLADDSVTAQNMGRRILTDAGYEVTTVNNGSAALKKIADVKPDLIVLDVYMPGYGGLEVCQRLRESDDTARIPVLLTVGKLEPFKIEEVRRVRADAFIVKPFEASELLTALTKLEDRIVPVAQPRKPGRLPKPNATVDEFMGTARQYGDTETGWKNRLRIPPPHRKSQPEFPEPEPDRPREAKPRPEQEREEAKPKLQEKPKEVTAKVVHARAELNLPPDITAEEIAAIQAAAAAFGTPSEPTQKPKGEVEELREKPIAEPEVAAAQPGANVDKPVEAATLASTETASPVPPPETATAAEVATSQAEKPAESAAPVDVVATPESTASEQASEAQNKLAEHEVAAVLASLEFVNGTASSANGAESEPDEPFFATIAAANAREESPGPRWVATPVPLAEDESSLILEQEMQKALAAMAALDASEAAAPAVIPEPAAVASAAEAPPASPSASDSAEAHPEESPFVQGASQIDEQPVSPQPADAIAASAAVEPAAVEEHAAYAAAASTGSAVGESTVSIEAAAPALAPESAPLAAEPSEPQRESELAAAWASWKQIRESVVSPQLASQIAEAAASPAASFAEPPFAESSAELSAVEPSNVKPSTAEAAPAELASAESATIEPTSVEAVQPEPATAAEPEVAANGDESGAIASIVDTVLAELKPKLMQEIAKKMGKEKKKS